MYWSLALSISGVLLAIWAIVEARLSRRADLHTTVLVELFATTEAMRAAQTALEATLRELNAIPLPNSPDDKDFLLDSIRRLERLVRECGTAASNLSTKAGAMFSDASRRAFSIQELARERAQAAAERTMAQSYRERGQTILAGVRRVLVDTNGPHDGQPTEAIE